MTRQKQPCFPTDAGKHGFVLREHVMVGYGHKVAGLLAGRAYSLPGDAELVQWGRDQSLDFPTEYLAQLARVVGQFFERDYEGSSGRIRQRHRPAFLVPKLRSFGR